MPNHAHALIEVGRPNSRKLSAIISAGIMPLKSSRKDRQGRKEQKPEEYFFANFAPLA